MHMFIDRSKFCVQFLKGSPKEHSCETTFEKGHSRNIPVKLFQNRSSGSRGEHFFRIAEKKKTFRCHGNQSFQWNQILWTMFKEDLPRNIPAKFGPNLPSGLGGIDV